jgi:hypothetical protein
MKTREAGGMWELGNFKCSAGFQPALGRQDGGATFKSGQHPKWRRNSKNELFSVSNTGISMKTKDRCGKVGQKLECI